MGHRAGRCTPNKIKAARAAQVYVLFVATANCAPPAPHPIVMLRLLTVCCLDHALRAELVGGDGLAQHRDGAIRAQLPGVLACARWSGFAAPRRE